jgi:RNA polymerase sigma-70 factor, ECF subfamily
MSDALNQFLAERERYAFRMAQLATGHSDDAMDIVQDAMMKLVQKYQARPADEWGPLFHRILQRQITDWHRKQTLNNRLFGWLDSSDDDAQPMQSVKDSVTLAPGQSTQTKQALNTLQTALQALPMRQRQAFLLRCWQGMDTNQTAEAMGCSSGSVKTHYHRALTELRLQLGDTWP